MSLLQLPLADFSDPASDCTSLSVQIITRALLRLERTMNLLEGGKGGWGREGGEGAEGTRGRGGEGGMSVIHILICMFNSNPMIPQLNNNLT